MRFLYKYKRFSQYLIEVMTGFYEIVYLQKESKESRKRVFVEEQSSYKVWTDEQNSQW